MTANQVIKYFLIFSVIFGLQIYPLFAQSDDDCLSCHEDNELTTKRNGKTVSMFVEKKVLNKSAHNKITCIKCHKDAAVEEFPHNENLDRVNCGSCHSNYSEMAKSDIHSKFANVEGKKIPDCKSCHNTHNVLNTSLIADKNQQYCKQCHQENVLTGKYHFDNAINNKCLECHTDANYKSLVAGSVHNNLMCSNCHSYAANNIEGHQTATKNENEADCFVCHGNIASIHKESIHGVSLSQGVEESANCWSCHGSHSICSVKSDSSMVNPRNLVSTCGKCHDNLEFNKKFNSSIKQPGKMYSQSVHGKLSSMGKQEAATCLNCHGVHDIKNRVQEGSKISAANLPETCSQCHKKAADEYTQSIHGIAAKKGVRESPTCNNCHSEHNIQSFSTLHESKEINKLQEITCLQCHQNIILSERFGLNAQNTTNYQDSYHGLAVMHGDTSAAMCVDCHGVHKILPEYDEQSSINKKNVANTCRKCHEDADPNFATSYSHTVTSDPKSAFIENIVRNIYFWLIVAIIGSMIIHNIIIFIHDVYERWKDSKTKIKIPRLTRNEFIQHIFLTISFITLAMTGFQLKYPDSWWANGMSSIGIDEALRRNIHRGAAIILVLLSVYHVVYLIFTKRGRYILKSMLPVLSDFKLVMKNMKFHLGLSKKHPEFDNFNYMEKAEYWALVWGTIIMAITGLVLWFPALFVQHSPVWIVKVSEIIHFYEAILATLAIVVWHLFFVMFRPKNYPIDFTTFDGKITTAHFKESHQLRFTKIIIEWLEVKAGKRKEKKMSHITRLFMKSIEKQGINPDEFVNNELESDQNLKDMAKQKGLV